MDPMRAIKLDRATADRLGNQIFNLTMATESAMFWQGEALDGNRESMARGLGVIASQMQDACQVLHDTLRAAGCEYVRVGAGDWSVRQVRNLRGAVGEGSMDVEELRPADASAVGTWFDQMHALLAEGRTVVVRTVKREI